MNKLGEQAIKWIGLGAWIAALLWAKAAWSIPIFEVYVLSASPETLTKVQEQVADAYLVVDQQQDQPLILAGTFINRALAEKRREELQKLGVTVRVVEREKSSPTQTTPPQASAASPSPPSASPSSGNASAPAPTATPASVAPPSTEPVRPFAVMVLNPNQDPGLANRLLRFFPNAAATTYQQQSALQTGSFSQLAQAKEQARWLSSQGYAALVVPLNPTPSPPAIATTPTVAPVEGEQYWVLVADPTGEKLAQVKQILQTALPLRYDDLQVIKTGGFASEQAAQAQVDQLASQGYEAGIFPADLRRVTPLLPSSRSSTPSPAATAATPSTPAATPPSTTQTSSPSDPVTTGFLVIVPQSGSGDQLAQIQTVAPDAFLRRYQERPVIQVGTYRQRLSAEQAIQTLNKLGVTGQIVPLGSP